MSFLWKEEVGGLSDMLVLEEVVDWRLVVEDEKIERTYMSIYLIYFFHSYRNKRLLPQPNAVLRGGKQTCRR